MSFFDKIIDALKGDEQAGELNLEEVDQLLEKELGKREKELLNSCSQNIDEIHASAKEIQKITRKLKEEEIPEDMAERLTRIAETSKPAFVKSVEEAIQPLLKDQEPDSLEELRDFQKEVEQVLESMGKAHTGQGRYLNMVYEGEVKEVKKESKNILYQNDALEEKIPPHEEKISDIHSLIEKTRKMQEKTENLESLEKEIREIEKELQEKKQEKQEKEQELEKHKESQEYEELLSKKEKIKELKDKRKSLENKVLNLLTPLKRPLKKYRRQAYIEEKETERMVDDYIQEPVKRFFRKESGDLDGLLEDVRETVEKDKIDFKEKEKRKTLEKIDRVLNRKMQKLREKYQGLGEKRKELQKEIENSQARKKLKKIEETISSLEKDIQRLKEKRKNLEKRSKDTDEKIKDSAGEIEEEVYSLTGKDIKVSYP